MMVQVVQSAALTIDYLNPKLHYPVGQNKDKRMKLQKKMQMMKQNQNITLTVQNTKPYEYFTTKQDSMRSCRKKDMTMLDHQYIKKCIHETAKEVLGYKEDKTEINRYGGTKRLKQTQETKYQNRQRQNNI